MIKQDMPGRKADIWSFGCTIIEMVTGKRPWSEIDNTTQLMYTIASSKKPPPIPGSILLLLSDDFKDFLSYCFSAEPSERFSTTDLLSHKFLIE